MKMVGRIARVKLSIRLKRRSIQYADQDCIDRDSAEKPPIPENSGHQKKLTMLRKLIVGHL